jgi:hypothetical protein
MKAPEWVEDRGCHRLRIGAFFIRIEKERGKYRASVFDVLGEYRSKNLYSTLDEAKASGIRIAQRMLKKTNELMALVTDGEESDESDRQSHP